MIDVPLEVLMYALAMITGAGLGVLVPYILRAWVDPKVTLDVKCLVTLIFSTVIAVLFVMPTEVQVITWEVLRLAILAGFGLQVLIYRIADSIVKKGWVQRLKPG